VWAIVCPPFVAAPAPRQLIEVEQAGRPRRRAAPSNGIGSRAATERQGGWCAMVTQVEHKHWWTQEPFSWAVEAALVIALLAGVAVAATQARDRDATITRQAAVIGQQAATIGRQAVSLERFETLPRPMSRLAEVDAALIAAYEARENARGQGERALAAADHQGWEAALTQEGAAQGRIDELRFQRELMSYTPPT
jgi:hypothetical protein